MQDYLMQAVNSCNERYKPFSLSHYTNIENIINILESGYIWLSDYNNMNDLFEKELLNRCDCDGNLFYLSFSKTEESLAMYKMYGNGESSVILRIPSDLIEEMMSSSYHGEYAGGADDDGAFPSYRRKINIVKNGLTTEECTYALLFCTDIVYLDPYSGTLIYQGLKNDKISCALKSEYLVGSIKYLCWEYEKEVRLSAKILDSTGPIERVAIKLPSDFSKRINVILGPEFDEDKYHDMLFELRRHGVLCQNSVYDNMYRDPRAKRSSSNDIFIQNYIGCTYSGFDSWGDRFTIFVESVKNGIMSWKWINEIDVDDRKISISIDMKTYLDSDLCSHYEIDHREYIYEDPKAYLRYSYSGVIQLVENKVLVTYNSGQLYSYLYGGSGADGYFGTGAWRMGANLLTELQERNTILKNEN